MAAKRILLTGAAVPALAGVVLAAAPRPGVALQATPAAETVNQGQAAVFQIALKRIAGYGRTVNLYVSDVPRGVSVVWQIRRPNAAASDDRPTGQIVTSASTKVVVRPPVTGRATLILVTSARTPLRGFRPLVSARGNAAQAKLRLGLTVRPDRPEPSTTPFSLSGAVAGPLRPGTTQPLELTISNPFNFALRLTGLDVAVADATGAPGCNGPANYAVEPAQVAYPLVVPPGSSRLGDLAGVAALPRVTMLDLPVNQDACKGARVQLDLSGTAGK